ncbi:MAG: hypothetical protein P4L33_11685 [Capsulimonadaceae bacterium]|nr:hypothetical protein [Capsulimonadaceae bacterium]
MRPYGQYFAAAASILIPVALVVLPVFGVRAHASNYSINELVVLDSFEGFGDPGTIDTSRQIVAPGDKLGFSVRFQFNRDAGAPVDWWSLHADLPQAVDGYDTVSFDIYKESADPSAALTISLAEATDNRWKLWDHALSDVPTGQWVHVSVKRADMRIWQLSKRAPDFADITRFTIEPRSGKSVFYIDNAILTGPGKTPMNAIGTDDDGLIKYPFHQPLQPALPVGAVLYPFDIVPATGDIEHATQVGLRNAIGTDLATPFAHYGPVALSLTKALNACGIPTAWYSQFGNGYTKYLTKRQAWDENAIGRTLNTMPALQSGWDYEHSIAVGHPAVFDAAKDRIDALLRTGVTTWVIPDYVFPYYETQFGFADSMIEAFRKDLQGTGGKLHVRQGFADKPVSFEDYFRAYNGFFPAPQELGLKTWNDYTPPRPDDAGPFADQRRALFLHLRAYEWLKLPDHIGRYAISKGAQPLWLILNGESTYVTPDYVYLLRSRGVGNLMPESFGNAGLLSEAAYSSLPYLRAEADRNSTRFSANMETGAGGHSAPYWDWRIAYNAAYAITSAGGAQNLDNDFVDEATIDQMNTPSKGYQFTRYRDAVIKAWAFRNARAEKAQVPATKILCVTDRPVGRESYDIFDTVTTEYAATMSLSRAHFAFRVRDSLDLAKVIGDYKVIFYSPKTPRVGDFALLKSWLAASPGRVLVTHTFVPTRDARGYWNFDHGTTLGAADGGDILGLGKIGTTKTLHVKITKSTGAWQSFFPTGFAADLPAPLTTAQHGEPMVLTNDGPLVSRVRIGQSQVIYLHFASQDPANPAVLEMNMNVARAVAQSAGIVPECESDQNTSVQMFSVPGGHSVVSWNVPTLNAWHFEYVPGLPAMKYDAPGAEINVRVPEHGVAKALVYDVWANKLTEVAPDDGIVTLRHSKTVTGLDYVGPDTPLFRQSIAKIQATRNAADAAGFAQAP